MTFSWFACFCWLASNLSNVQGEKSENASALMRIGLYSDVLLHVLPRGDVNYVLQRDLHAHAGFLEVNGVVEEHRDRAEEYQRHTRQAVDGQRGEDQYRKNAHYAVVVCDSEYDTRDEGYGYGPHYFPGHLEGGLAVFGICVGLLYILRQKRHALLFGGTGIIYAFVVPHARL